jgi:hypothetical protein
MDAVRDHIGASSACPMSDEIPPQLEKAKRDILSWLNAETPDE